jgi:hypothetical protein
VLAAQAGRAYLRDIYGLRTCKISLREAGASMSEPATTKRQLEKWIPSGDFGRSGEGAAGSVGSGAGSAGQRPTAAEPLHTGPESG